MGYDIHQLHLHFLSKIKNEIQEIYLNRMIHAFALSLISVFVPIYLLNLGYAFNLVLIYLISEYLAFLVFSPISAFLNKKLGVKHTIFLNIPFLLLHFSLLFTLQSFNWPLIFIGISLGISKGLYWISINSDFATHSNKLLGKQVGYLVSLPKIVVIITPFIGGLIILFLGMHSLIYIVSFLLLSSLVPLFLTADYKPNLKYSWKKVFSKKNIKFFDSFIAKGILFVSGLIWIFFIHSIVETYSKIGLAVTLGALGAALFTILIGRLSDKYSEKKLLKFGAFSNAFFWLILLFVTTELQIFILAFFKGILFVLISIPLFILACKEAKKENVTEFMVFREIGLSCGKILPILILLFIPQKFMFTFIMASLASIYFLFVKFK